MNIYIPTRGRTEKQTTWDELPSKLKETAVLVCPAEEVLIHAKQGRPAIPCPVEGIIRKRQWIMDLYPKDRQLCMLDDDLIFLKRKDPSAWNLARCTAEEVVMLFDQAEQLLSNYPQVGISPRQGNNRFFPESLVHNNRVTNAHWYDLTVIRHHNIRFHDPLFPETFTMEDFHVTLSLLTAGYSNAIITDFAWDQVGGSNSKGGCSLYRNSATQSESAKLLAQRHPGLVRLAEKETKGAWAGVAEGGVRTDVVISWKKAREQGNKSQGTK